ncbi:hypothetical protein LZC95_51430 [Pendulispora brunnea]|uniref:Uncharacterized protein n=1 Tax=Pendulispora brunnea TaxID=2905690 RepID=A0ABZ2KBW7_9BACT
MDIVFAWFVERAARLLGGDVFVSDGNLFVAPTWDGLADAIRCSIPEERDMWKKCFGTAVSRETCEGAMKKYVLPLCVPGPGTRDAA